MLFFCTSFVLKKIQQTPNFNLIAPIIKIRCLFDLFTEKKIQQTPNFNLISPTKMNMKTKQWENINNVTKRKKHQTNNSNETSVEYLLYIGLFLLTVVNGCSCNKIIKL
jgi:hypothetical protein